MTHRPHARRLCMMTTAWHRWWCRNAPPHVMGVFRIAFGGFLLFYWGLRAPHVDMLFSDRGIVLPLLDQPAWLHTLLTPPPAWAAYTLYAAFMVALVCVTLGWGMRVAGLVALAYNWYAWQLSLHLLGASFDRLFAFVLLVVALSGADRIYALRMRLRHGSWTAWEPVAITAQRLIAVQITLTYLGVGWQKVWLPDWKSGEVLAWGFIGRWATPLGYWVAQRNWPLWMYDAVVWQVKFVECVMPFGFWLKGWRWVFFAWGLLFHGLIALLISIWWFMVLIPAYIVFFSPEEFLAFLERRAPRLAGRRVQ